MSSESFANALVRAAGNGMNVMDLVGTADRLKATEPAQNLAKLYQTWLDHHADDPLRYAVLFNYSVVLSDMNDFPAARAALETSIELNSQFAPSRINLGRINERMGTPQASIAQWTAAVDGLPQVAGMNITHKTTALNQMARVLESMNQDETTENVLRQSLEIDINQRDVVQHYLAARQRLCKWPLVVPYDRVTRETLMCSISPLSMAVYSDDPMLQLASNFKYNLSDIGNPVGPIITNHYAANNRPKGAPLRIGYVSSDLREHAIGFLMAEVFELHDRKNVEVFIYYCGVIPDDPMLQRIKATADHWTNINDMTDEAVAQRIADDGIQILVDVNGYTRDGRIKVFPMRPAPVIVNWLGFPGSMGSPYHQYIIADEWIVPPENDIYFTEKVMRLPCYQPNDRKRKISGRTPTRAEMGLPENAMVYCCFNGTQKISKPTFDRWLNILSRVQGSVLWILGGTADAQNRLKAYAAQNGVSPDRLIFADKMANPDHLARYPLADLFLDASPYGAHTTASDALWMGVPVITLSGRAFASRVCGSLVRAAGLPELACTAPQDFVDKAVMLGKDKNALLAYRQRLAATRDTCDLFNTPKLVSHLEKLYQQMWQEYETGKLPQPDLRNLDVYLEIGAKQDHDAVEMLAVEDYRGWWENLLATRHAHRPVEPDNRLWPTHTKQQNGNTKEKGGALISIQRGGEIVKYEKNSGHGWRGLFRIASLR